MVTFFLALAICIVAALVSGALLLALTVENHRFWKRHQQRGTPFEQQTAKVNLIVPCKGVADDTRRKLEAFFFQDHPHFRISFAVEAATDPVVPLIRELQKENRFVESSIVVAGRATHCGQKVHNLLAAIAKLQVEVDVLAFADMDALVKPSWLRWLTIGVGREQVGARTGYRWMVPGKNNLPTLIGVTLNNSVAACLGKGSHNLVWGGSWAIHRKVFEQTGMREAWAQVLSDDFVASRTIRNSTFAGKLLKIQFEPQCLCETTVNFGWSSLMEFIVRQLKITRLYAPRHWTVATLNSLVTQFAFWGSVVAWIAVMSSGDRGWLPTTLMFSFIGIYLLATARAAIRQNMARRLIPGWRKQRQARRFDLFAWPVTGLFALVALIESSVGKRISWSNIHYRIQSGGRTMVLGRNVESESWPVRTASVVPDPKLSRFRNSKAKPETADLPTATGVPGTNVFANTATPTVERSV
ncbi:glycosyltransferase [Mariniblastus fucicola]|uniref:N-glycosyltransferase n=1 Tax=Mariniblastus fucicola TaxID=980251 RepID=A0A5B9PDS5_9BACT|nr:glycosyltransferase [Mariniblastus fucicola]QEG23280.1 hypothetical protein MFFC18_31760 [Mariniblastus fucicola]